MTDRRVWGQVSRFESHDYVANWFQSKHNREIGTAKTKEINSSFIQGREYFHSASEAATSVRPLLLYYGVLSLSKGVILLLDRSKRETSLKPSHGLQEVGWQSVLSDGIQHVLDIPIRATAGTFGELVGVVGNVQATGWWTRPGLQMGYYSIAYDTPKFLTDGSQFTLADLLSRDHRLLSSYASVTGRTGRVHLGEVVADENGLHVSITPFAQLTAEDFQTAFNLPTGTELEFRIGTIRHETLPNFHYDLKGTDLNTLKILLPWTQYTTNDGFFILDDFPNGDRISEFLRTFLISFILGMLVRYFPSKWISLLRNDKGDNAQPVIMAAMDTVETDFPALISPILG